MFQRPQAGKIGEILRNPELKRNKKLSRLKDGQEQYKTGRFFHEMHNPRNNLQPENFSRLSLLLIDCVLHKGADIKLRCRHIPRK